MKRILIVLSLVLAACAPPPQPTAAPISTPTATRHPAPTAASTATPSLTLPESCHPPTVDKATGVKLPRSEWQLFRNKRIDFEDGSWLGLVASKRIINIFYFDLGWQPGDDPGNEFIPVQENQLVPFAYQTVGRDYVSLYFTACGDYIYIIDKGVIKLPPPEPGTA